MNVTELEEKIRAKRFYASDVSKPSGEAAVFPKKGVNLTALEGLGPILEALHGTMDGWSQLPVMVNDSEPIRIYFIETAVLTLFPAEQPDGNEDVELRSAALLLNKPPGARFVRVAGPSFEAYRQKYSAFLENPSTPMASELKADALALAPSFVDFVTDVGVVADISGWNAIYLPNGLGSASFIFSKMDGIEHGGWFKIGGSVAGHETNFGK